MGDIFLKRPRRPISPPYNQGFVCLRNDSNTLQNFIFVLGVSEKHIFNIKLS